jgi:hypothetical protein
MGTSSDQDHRIGPLLSASALILVEDFNISFTEVTLLTGYQLCAVGAVSSPFAQAEKDKISGSLANIVVT